MFFSTQWSVCTPRSFW